MNATITATIRIHTCDHCGRMGPWTSSWSWWGSFRSCDEGEVVKSCSESCRTAMGDPAAVFARKFGRKPNRRPHQ